MKASIVDLRYKSKEILEALEQNETVTILDDGNVKGVITPPGQASCRKIEEHPFFGMNAQSGETVREELSRLRNLRHDL